MRPTDITIIGLGLIGGSLAKAIKKKPGPPVDIVACDSDSDTLELALREGIISKGCTSLCEEVFNSDIIFICTPLRQTISYIIQLAPHIRKGCIITDVCSTKQKITEFVDSLPNPPCFIGGHPMAGTEKSGYANSFSHLFENAYYALTPSSSTSDEALDTLVDIIKEIGAIPLVMTPEEHDRAAGAVSHLPHIVAASLVNLVKELDSGKGTMKLLAAGGFRDITRIASSNPALWESIVADNKKHLKDLLALYVNCLEDFHKKLENSDSESIYNFFAGAGEYRDSISSRAAGFLQPLYRLAVDVEDKPGIIGEIATILGKSNINIKNINVANNREFEQGCLIITLPDIHSVDIAVDLLKDKGYKVYKIN